MRQLSVHLDKKHELLNGINLSQGKFVQELKFASYIRMEVLLYGELESGGKAGRF